MYESKGNDGPIVGIEYSYWAHKTGVSTASRVMTYNLNGLVLCA